MKQPRFFFFRGRKNLRTRNKPLVGNEKLVHVLAFVKYTRSNGLGAQVRGMSVSYNSIFQAGNHDMLAFSVSSKFVEKIFCHDACMYSTLKMMTTLHELALYYLPAPHFSILTHIWVPSECGRWNWGLWRTHAPHEYPETLLPSAQLSLTHPFSHHTPSYPPSLFKLTPYPWSPLKTCEGNPLLAPLARYATEISLLFYTFQLSITPRKLPHTLYARSMSWPSSSHTSVSKPHFIMA